MYSQQFSDGFKTLEEVISELESSPAEMPFVMGNIVLRFSKETKRAALDVLNRSQNVPPNIKSSLVETISTRLHYQNSIILSFLADLNADSININAYRLSGPLATFVSNFGKPPKVRKSFKDRFQR